MAEIPMVNDCEHHYASHMRGGLALHVQICMLCGAVDFDDLAEQVSRVKALAARELAAEAELKPGPYWVHVAGWLRRRADQIEQGGTDA